MSRTPNSNTAEQQQGQRRWLQHRRNSSGGNRDFQQADCNVVSLGVLDSHLSAHILACLACLCAGGKVTRDAGPVKGGTSEIAFVEVHIPTPSSFDCSACSRRYPSRALPKFVEAGAPCSRQKKQRRDYG